MFVRNLKFSRVQSAAKFSTASKPLVTVTGLDGFLGPYTALKFLQDGGFKVRGTVWDMKNQQKLDAIKRAYGDHFSSLEIVEAELLDKKSMHDALEGSVYVAHLASPFRFDNKTRDELVKPAVDGTLGVMEACKAHGVKRCVLTSSFASVRGVAQKDFPEGGVFTEAQWSNVDRPEGLGDYAASKTLAELAAWDFLKDNGDPFELVTICPTHIQGPAIGAPNVVSENFIKSFLFNGKPDLPMASNFYVDVRDVAEAHYLSIKVAGAKNKRFITCGDCVTKEDIVK